MTSGSGSSMGSAHSTVTTFPHTFTLPLISRRRAWAAVLWSSYSRKQNPRFFFLSSGWWYNMTSFRPSVETRNGREVKKRQQVVKCIYSTKVTVISMTYQQTSDIKPSFRNSHKHNKIDFLSLSLSLKTPVSDVKELLLLCLVSSQILAVNHHSNVSHSSIVMRSSCGHNQVNTIKNVVMKLMNKYYTDLMEWHIQGWCRLTCDFCKFFNNLLFCFTLGDGANEQSIIGHRDAHADVFPRSNFIVVALRMDRYYCDK